LGGGGSGPAFQFVLGVGERGIGAPLVFARHYSWAGGGDPPRRLRGPEKERKKGHIQAGRPARFNGAPFRSRVGFLQGTNMPAARGAEKGCWLDSAQLTPHTGIAYFNPPGPYTSFAGFRIKRGTPGKGLIEGGTLRTNFHRGRRFPGSPVGRGGKGDCWGVFRPVGHLSAGGRNRVFVGGPLPALARDTGGGVTGTKRWGLVGGGAVTSLI